MTRKNNRLQREVEELRQKERQLGEIVRFEKLLSEISSRLVHLPVDEIEREIEDGLRRVVELLEVDRGGVYIFSGDRTRFPRKYFWGGEGVPESAAVLEDQKFPWLSEKLRRGEMVVIPRVDDLPEEAARDRRELQKYQNRSSLAIPLKVGDRIFGAVTFGAVRRERKWPGELIQRFRLVGEIFASALARKQSEEALRKAELEYRTVAEFPYDWEYWSNPDGTIRYISPSCRRISGYSPDDFIKRPSLIREIILPIDREAWDRHFRESRRGIPSHEIQFRIRKPDGQIRWIEHACQSVRSPQGNFLGYRVSNRDVTERKLAEETARKKDQSLAEAQRIAHLGSWHWDIETNDLAWSDEVYRIFGIHPQEFKATYDAFLECVHPDDREALQEAVKRSLADPSVPYRLEHRVIRPDGSERIVQEQGEVTFDDGGRPIRMIGTVQDITERKRAEELLQKSQDELRRLSAQLLSVQEEERKRIARELHDGVGQSLSALKFLLENRLGSIGQNAFPGDLQALESMIPMIQNTIEEVRRMQTDLRPPILDDLGILATLSWFCRDYQKVYSGIRIEPQIEVREDEIPQGLKTTLYRILQEAMNNVAKHSRADRVCLSLFRKDGWVHLRIEDNGRGFDLQRALSDERPGRGFGLASMKERTELSGGSFSLESEKGKGTVIQASWKISGED
ncbi:MAG: PAS domain-containing protein [Syntrophaceae bacterium]|nr:PAS domain-containing protein [Syntrophaceae bacterium]